jgi:hypothetical protein
VKNKVKTSIIAVCLLCTYAVAQQNSRSGAVRLQNDAASTSAKKVVTLAGRVSDDGKLLVSEDQDRWAVNNPGMLASHAGRAVTVKCQLSVDQNSIHVLSVTGADTKYVAAHNDAAFRR